MPMFTPRNSREANSELSLNRISIVGIIEIMIMVMMITVIMIEMTTEIIINPVGFRLLPNNR